VGLAIVDILHFHDVPIEGAFNNLHPIPDPEFFVARHEPFIISCIEAAFVPIQKVGQTGPCNGRRTASHADNGMQAMDLLKKRVPALLTLLEAEEQTARDRRIGNLHFVAAIPVLAPPPPLQGHIRPRTGPIDDPVSHKLFAGPDNHRIPHNAGILHLAACRRVDAPRTPFKGSPTICGLVFFRTSVLHTAHRFGWGMQRGVGGRFITGLPTFGQKKTVFSNLSYFSAAFIHI
jgi:hypothetical protein